ncbi:ABC transporter ATP-binding protein [Micromonospora sp. CPCC 206061]|uniref:ABC transporter ATP-binding protein n=1 Tax=Micromonospora sp. CPCC 206061 TaxID=3122410 RepID=UPI002FF10F85
MNALETTGLGKRYRRAWALRDCSLAVPAGKVVALVGPNGAGKTTLLHAAMGLLTPTRGEARVLGEAPRTSRTLARVAFVAQDKPLYDGFRVSELLRMGRALNPRWDDGVARCRLAELRIPLDRRAGKLSGGQQAQIALTLALAKRPDLLLLDEPLANLDPLARSEIMGHLMSTVAERDITVVLSTHVIADLAQTCDWLILLSGGRVQVSGDVEELLGAHQMLTGPVEAADALAASTPVVSRRVVGRQVHLLVRASRPIPDPRWSARPVAMEDLVLAYLREPDAAALPRPTLATLAPEGNR